MLSSVFLPMASGAALGLAVAAPVGPVALLCIQRSLAAGAGLGIVTGLGAASVHVFYAALAIAGAGAVAAELAAWSLQIRLVSCVVLVVLGVRVLRRSPPSAQHPSTIRAPAAFASSFLLALCNPLTIVPYLMFASSVAALDRTTTVLTSWSAFGVFVGAGGWYCAISGAAALFRSGLPPIAIRGLNRVAGAMLIGFGLLTACR